MEQFKGFPAKMQFTPLPNLFFGALLPQISDITELKVTLYLLATLYRKRGYPRFVSLEELLGSASLMRSLSQADGPPAETLARALEMATKRGTILYLVLDKGGATENVYFLNTESDREAVAKIQRGELSPKLARLSAVQLLQQQLGVIRLLFHRLILQKTLPSTGNSSCCRPRRPDRQATSSHY